MKERKKIIVNRGILELLKKTFNFKALSRISKISPETLQKNFFKGSYISKQLFQKLIKIFPNIPPTHFEQSVEIEYTPPFCKKTIEAIKQQDFLIKHKLNLPDKYENTKEKR